jgi:GNAT superfamily N-acetyltransferase
MVAPAPFALKHLFPADDAALAAQLLALQRAAYALEAELLGTDRIPPLHERLDALRAAPLRWLGAVDADGLAGAVAWSRDAGGIELERLIVAPRALRRGIGRRLVAAVQELAVPGRVAVETGRANIPARRLYERLGFRRLDDRLMPPGVWVTRYEWSQPA